MKSRIEVMVRIACLTFFATLPFASLSAQTYTYPSSWTCGGTIRARVLSASASAVSFEIQKATNNCSGTVPFDPPGGWNQAHIRANTASGAILGSATYFKNDPRVIVNVPGFTSGAKSYVATIDSFAAGPMTVSVASPDFLASWQSVATVVNPGSALVLQGQVKNAGAGAAPSSTASFVYSTSAVPTAANSIRIGSALAVGPLGAGASSPALTTTWTVPSSLGGTTIYVALLADSGSAVAEANEANNVYTPATAVRVGAIIGPLLEVKIGVVAWIDTLTATQQQAVVEQIVREVGGGQSVLTGNGRKAMLVITAEMRWDATQPTRSSAGDFSRYVQFAKICRDRGVHFTPQFSPHNLPDWVKQDYARDLQTPPGFLPLAVSSFAWKTPAQSWIRRGIDAFAAEHLFDVGGPIDEVFVGNEIHFEKNAANDADAARRAGELATMIAGLVDAARQELDLQRASRIGVGSKLLSYLFPPHTAVESSYTKTSLQTLDASFHGLFPIDSYSKSAKDPVCSEHTWLIGDDIAAAGRTTTKPIALAEFNYDRGKCSANMGTQAIVDAVRDGIANRVTYFTFFAWNPADRTWKMEAPQKDGLLRAFYATVGR